MQYVQLVLPQMNSFFRAIWSKMDLWQECYKIKKSSHLKQAAAPLESIFYQRLQINELEALTGWTVR